MIGYHMFETLCREMHIDCIKSSVDSRMVEVDMIPGNNWTNKSRRKSNFTIMKDERYVVDELIFIILVLLIDELIKELVIGLVLRNNSKINRKFIIFFDIIHVFHMLLTKRNDRVATNHISNMIIFSRSVDEFIVKFLKNQASTTNPFRIKIVEAKIFMVQKIKRKPR